MGQMNILEYKLKYENNENRHTILDSRCLKKNKNTLNRINYCVSKLKIFPMLFPPNQNKKCCAGNQITNQTKKN